MLDFLYASQNFAATWDTDFIIDTIFVCNETVFLKVGFG